MGYLKIVAYVEMIGAVSFLLTEKNYQSNGERIDEEDGLTLN